MTPAVPGDFERYFDSSALISSTYCAAVYHYTQKKLAGEETGWILKDIHWRDSSNASETAVLDSEQEKGTKT